MENSQQFQENFEGFKSFIDNPTLENLGPIDLDQVAETDRPFAKRIIELASSDPDLLKRVVETRIKLGNEVKITNAEADEIINKLAAKYFAGDLNLSGYKFDKLKMARVIVTGSLYLSWAMIGRNDQTGMEVGGNSDQRGMEVGGNSDQHGIKGGDNYQQGMKVKGFSNQDGMKVEGDSNQYRMKVGGDSDQEGMEVGGSSIQEGMKVGGDNYQQGMKVKGFSNQDGMKVEGDSDQYGMKVGLNIAQEGMEVGGLWCKPDGTIVIHQ